MNYPDSVSAGDPTAPWNQEDAELEVFMCEDCEEAPTAHGLDTCEACHLLIVTGELSELALEIYAEEAA